MSNLERLLHKILRIAITVVLFFGISALAFTLANQYVMGYTPWEMKSIGGNVVSIFIILAIIFLLFSSKRAK